MKNCNYLHKKNTITPPKNILVKVLKAYDKLENLPRSRLCNRYSHDSRHFRRRHLPARPSHKEIDERLVLVTHQSHAPIHPDSQKTTKAPPKTIRQGPNLLTFNYFTLTIP